MSQNKSIVINNNGTINTIKNVYMVVQHQPIEPNYDNATIYTYINREAAEECAKRLNLEYAKNVVLDEDGLFYTVVNDADDYHYYTVEPSLLETEVDDEVYDPAKNKTDDHEQVYVIACYSKETMEFRGFYGNPITKDKDTATYYNEDTAETVAAFIEDEEDYSTEIFHYNDAKDAE